MNSHRQKRRSTLNQVVLTTLISVFVVFSLTIALMTNTLFNRSIERAKNTDMLNTMQVTDVLKIYFNNLAQLLTSTQKSLAEIDFRSKTADVHADSVLIGTLELNRDLYSIWFVLNKNVYHENDLLIGEYVRHDGKIVKSFSLSAEKILERPETARWYYEPLTTGKPYYGAIELLDYGTGEGTVSVATVGIPILSDGIIIGVCGADMFYDDMFIDIIHNLHEEQNRVVNLISNDLTILHGYDHSNNGKNLADFPYDDKVLEQVRNAIKRGETYSHELVSPFLNEKVFGYFQPIFIGDETEQSPLYLHIGTPLSELHADAYSITYMVIAASSVCMLLILGIIYFNANRIVRPIRALTNRAQQVTAGDFSIGIFDSPDDDLQNNNEVGVLKRALMNMLHMLNENLRTVEKRVDERTRDLQRSNNYIKQLIEHTSTISLLLNGELNIIYCSDSIKSLMVYDSLDNYIGISFTDALENIKDKEYIKRSQLRMSRIITGNEDIFVEDDVINWPNGKSCLYRITYKRVLNEDGSLDGIVIVMRDLTDVRMEEAERRINDMLSSSMLPCLIWDESGHIIAYNKDAAHVFGAPDDLTPDEYNEFFLSTIQPELQLDECNTENKRQDLIREALEKGFAHNSFWLRKDKGIFTCFTVNIIRFSWLFNYRLVVHYYDLTDIMAEEAKARQAEELMRLMFNTTPLGCMMADENMKILDCNDELVKIFGIPVKKTFMDDFLRFSPEYQPDGQLSTEKANNYIKETLEKGQVVFEWMHQNLYGEPVPTEVTLVRIKRNDKFIVISYIRDLREYMRMREEANEANEQVKLMLDSNPMICVMRDENNNIIDCNQAALDIFGVASKAEFCRDYFNFYPEFQPDGQRSIDKAKENIRELLATGVTGRYEWMLRTAAGEPLPVEGTHVRIHWKDAYRVLTYSRDLREAKAKERQMAEIAERERKAEIQREAAQAANETKSRFLANMSHEIRTPMNAILGMSELLIQEKISKRQRQYVSDIKTAAMALLDIINDILDISKLNEGKLSLVPEHYDFNILIDNVCSIARFLVADKKVNFKLSMKKQESVYLYGDDTRLRQVLLNLLSNAIKFTDEGYVTLTVDLTDTTIKITVSDTGIGLLPEDIPALFEPFEQFDLNKNRKKAGTGLGLTIVKSILELMGGKISVESEYGKGTSLHVEIPKVSGDQTLINHPLNDGEIMLYAPDAKILVVDDNTVNLSVASGLLRLCQITAETVTSGQQAIERVQRNQYDLVFMDHRMPYMDGATATRIIRELGITTPIIALTASAVVGAKEMMLSAGMNDYLAKPIIKAELKHILKKWIPAEKLISRPPDTINQNDAVYHQEFWEQIEQIEGLSVKEGVSRVDGLREVYEKTLKLMTNEIKKSSVNLNRFLSADDMDNFRIEVHGMKGSLANIGALELAAKAYALETASGKMDKDFCVENLPTFIEGINDLNAKLEEAFSLIDISDDGMEIPPELTPVLNRLLNAVDEINLMLIERETENLNNLKQSGALQNKLEQIKDMLMIMDYDEAAKHIKELLNQA